MGTAKLSKNQIKLLRRLRRKCPILRFDLLRIISETEIEQLLTQGILSCDQEAPTDESGFEAGSVSATAIYTFTDIGYATVEQFDWFDWQYVLTYIVVPIIIGIVSSFISNFLFR